MLPPLSAHRSVGLATAFGAGAGAATTWVGAADAGGGGAGAGPAAGAGATAACVLGSAVLGSRAPSLSFTGIFLPAGGAGAAVGVAGARRLSGAAAAARVASLSGGVGLTAGAGAGTCAGAASTGAGGGSGGGSAATGGGLAGGVAGGAAVRAAAAAGALAGSVRAVAAGSVLDTSGALAGLERADVAAVGGELGHNQTAAPAASSSAAAPASRIGSGERSAVLDAAPGAGCGGAGIERCGAVRGVAAGAAGPALVGGTAAKVAGIGRGWDWVAVTCGGGAGVAGVAGAAARAEAGGVRFGAITTVASSLSNSAVRSCSTLCGRASGLGSSIQSITRRKAGEQSGRSCATSGVPVSKRRAVAEAGDLFSSRKCKVAPNA